MPDMDRSCLLFPRKPEPQNASPLLLPPKTIRGNIEIFCVVREAGLEPARRKAREPKSRASANFATLALKRARVGALIPPFLPKKDPRTVEDPGGFYIGTRERT